MGLGSPRPPVGSLLIDRTRSSPNHGARADNGGHWPDCIILHYTGMKDGPSAVDWLCNPASQVSCHYVVDEEGSILQLVPEDRRAWHAGRSSWAGVTDLNSASIGIEIVNCGHDFDLPPFPAVQIEAVIALCRDVGERHRIRPERILAHSDIAPGRKRDPGEHFPWARLAAAGIGHFVPMETGRGGTSFVPGIQSLDVTALQRLFAIYGYDLHISGIYDDATEVVVRAFQRHFRQDRVDGVADAETIATLRKLSEALPNPQHLAT